MGKRGPRKAPPALQELRQTQPCRRSPAPGTALAAPAKPPLPRDPPKEIGEGAAAAIYASIERAQRALIESGQPNWLGEEDLPLIAIAVQSAATWNLAKEALNARVKVFEEQQAGMGYLALFTTDHRGNKRLATELLAQERTGEKAIAAFRALGMPNKHALVAIEQTQRDAAGNEQATRLLFGGPQQ